MKGVFKCLKIIFHFYTVVNKIEYFNDTFINYRTKVATRSF